MCSTVLAQVVFVLNSVCEKLIYEKGFPFFDLYVRLFTFHFSSCPYDEKSRVRERGREGDIWLGNRISVSSALLYGFLKEDWSFYLWDFQISLAWIAGFYDCAAFQYVQQQGCRQNQNFSKEKEKDAHTKKWNWGSACVPAWCSL